MLSGILAALTVAAYGQGTLQLFNTDNSQASTPSSTTNGLFFLDTGSGAAKINQDFNVVFRNGATVIASFIGAGAVGDNTTFGVPGAFFDITGTTYTIAGVPSGTFPLTIEAWIGSATDFASATTKGSATYQQRVADPTAQPPQQTPSLIDMPSITLVGVVPEPSTFALAGLGAAALLIFRRRK